MNILPDLIQMFINSTYKNELTAKIMIFINSTDTKFNYQLQTTYPKCLEYSNRGTSLKPHIQGVENCKAAIGKKAKN